MRPFGKVFCILAPLLMWPIPAWTGDEGASQSGADERVMPDSNDNPEAVISRDEWKRRVEQGRARIQEARRELRRGRRAFRESSESPEKIATKRVLNDDTLEPGDIVATDKGLFLFRGKSSAVGQPNEFVPLGFPLTPAKP
jgi:hypothetical protein